MQDLNSFGCVAGGHIKQRIILYTIRRSSGRLEAVNRRNRRIKCTVQPKPNRFYRKCKCILIYDGVWLCIYLLIHFPFPGFISAASVAREIHGYQQTLCHSDMYITRLAFKPYYNISCNGDRQRSGCICCLLLQFHDNLLPNMLQVWLFTEQHWLGRTWNLEGRKVTSPPLWNWGEIED